jgi:hypothetical protein
MMKRSDGSSLAIIDVIYKAEILEHGTSDVSAIINQLSKLIKDLNFDYCDASSYQLFEAKFLE